MVQQQIGTTRIRLLGYMKPQWEDQVVNQANGQGATKVISRQGTACERGLRPIQIWVPDVRSRRFKAEAHKQSLAIAKSPTEKEDQAFVDAISWWCDQE